MVLRNLFCPKIWSPPTFDIHLHCGKRSIFCATTALIYGFR